MKLPLQKVRNEECGQDSVQNVFDALAVAIWKDGTMTFCKIWQKPADIINKQDSTMTHRVIDHWRLSEVGRVRPGCPFIFQPKNRETRN